MHFNAAAAVTPSGVPPVPSSTSTPASGQPVAIAPKMSPSVISLTRAPLARTSAIRLGVPVAVEDHHREVANRLALGLGDPAQVLRGGGGDVDRAGGLWADGDLVHVHARARDRTSCPAR